MLILDTLLHKSLQTIFLGTLCIRAGRLLSKDLNTAYKHLLIRFLATTIISEPLRREIKVGLNHRTRSHETFVSNGALPQAAHTTAGLFLCVGSITAFFPALIGRFFVL